MDYTRPQKIFGRKAKELKFLNSNEHFVKIGTNFCAVIELLFLASFIFPQAQQTPRSVEEIIFQSSQNLHQWGSINSFHGLPSERINAIAQTNSGSIWFATDNGLARFDGRRVQTNLSNGVSSIRISDLKVDKDGALWIATDRGAYYYIDDTFALISETADYSISSIAVTDDWIYLGEQNGLIFRTRRRKNSNELEPFIKAAVPLRSIAYFKERIFAGTYNSGLQRSNNGELEVVETRPRPFFINVLATGNDGNLWIGARTGSSASGLLKAEKLPELSVFGNDLGSVNAIAFDAKNNLWIGTDDHGAYHFNGDAQEKRFTFENTSGGLRSNRVLSTFVDREGVVWFGTDKGVSRYDPGSPRNEQVSTNVESSFVRTLFQAPNGIQFAGTNHGLFYYSTETGAWNSIAGFENEIVYSLAAAGTDRVVIGARGGIYSLNPANFSFEKIIERDARSLAFFDDGLFFSTPGKGVTRLNEKGLSELLPNYSTVFFVDDNLWIGTEKNGVFKFDGKSVAPVPGLKDLEGSSILTISGDEKNGMLFGTEKGIYAFQNNTLELLQNITDVRQIVVIQNAENQKEIWCASAEGLVSFAYTKNFGWISSKIDIEEGLVSQNLFALIALTDGSLVIGTNRGIVRYAIGNEKPLLEPTRIVSQRVHSTSELKNGIELDYPQNSLSIDVSAISSRTFPEQFQYSFVLYDGTDQILNKRFGSDSQFVMENLAPGNYRVEVQAFDVNLVASKPLVFTLVVEPAPFPIIAGILAVLLFIAVATLIWAIVSQRKISRTSEQLSLANKELSSARFDLANEAERERRRISRDLHDQTLADLRHLILMADEVSTEQAPKFRSEIENVSDEIRRICEDLSPSVLENIGFTAALNWALSNSVEQIAHEKEIETVFDCELSAESEEMLSRTDQIQIYRIAQEVLSNIVRHADPAKILMHVGKDDENRFLLEIADDGAQFEVENAKVGRGLVNIRARANLIFADVSWEKRELGMLFSLKK
ncbi:MAG: two-component regulator propeller domain-containing protein [Pyrinomonadaceae bacterium]